MKTTKILATLALLILSVPAFAANLLVPNDYSTIQSAINTAVSGDRVIVSPGTYYENINFNGKDITVTSIEPDNPTIVAATIIDAQTSGSVITFANGETSDAVLSGFTITGGKAQDGGGIRGYGTGACISKCIITGNSAETRGGGIFCENSRLKIINCTISRNLGESEWARGGGIYCWNSTINITNCIISGNSAGYGGGIFCGRSSLTVSQSVIARNSAHYGGGIACERGRIIMNHCTIADNLVSDGGGGISCWKSSSIISNSILWGNNATRYGPEIALTNDPNPSHLTISYSDIEENRAAIHTSSSSCTINWGQGNIDADPLFSDSANGDYCLMSESPCIDAGDPDYPYDPNETDLDGKPRVFDGRIDMGAYEFIRTVEVPMKFTPRTLNCCSKGNWVKAHFVLPEDFVVEDVDANSPAVIEPSGIESDHLNVFINEDSFVAIEIAFDRAEFCSNGPLDGAVTVTGLLTTGQEFYGADTIRIITNNLDYLGVFVSYWLRADCAPPDWCAGFDLDRNSAVNFTDFAMFDGCCIEFVK